MQKNFQQQDVVVNERWPPSNYHHQQLESKVSKPQDKIRICLKILAQQLDLLEPKWQFW